LKKPYVFVTGASGFIGSNLVDCLLRNGCRVIALDRRAPLLCYPEYHQKKDYIPVNGDVRDTALLQQILQQSRAEYVIHLAAVSTIQMGGENRRATMDINVRGTESLLRAVKAAPNIKGLIYASTDKVYGRLQHPAYTEDDPLAPLDSPYDQSKAEADQLVRSWCKKYGIPGVVLRFCNIYGKYDLLDTRIVPHTIRSVLEGRECLLRMYRDDEGHIQNFRRDLLYVGDLCGMLLKLVGKMEQWNCGQASPLWGEAFNLGAVRCYAMDEVIWKIEKLTGTSPPIRLELAGTLPELREQRMDFSKASRYLGFTPITTLEDGLRETIGWWKKNMLGKRCADEQTSA